MKGIADYRLVARKVRLAKRLLVAFLIAFAVIVSIFITELGKHGMAWAALETISIIVGTVTGLWAGVLLAIATLQLAVCECPFCKQSLHHLSDGCIPRSECASCGRLLADADVGQ